jgi:peptidoglycan-associated lipoprotein
MLRAAPGARSSTLLPALLGALMLAGCPKKPDPKPADDDDAVTMARPIADTLRVVELSPRSGPANASFPGTLSGRGFAPGAAVTVGVSPGEGVRVLGDDTLAFTVPPLPVGRYDVTVTLPSGSEATLRGALSIQAESGDCDRTTVRFGLDQDTLDVAATRALYAVLTCLDGSASPIRVEGHCDERGTTDYNLALGERRAVTVKQWLTGNGIAPSRITTVSYGEERPADPGRGEAAWAANRRAEVLLGR